MKCLIRFALKTGAKLLPYDNRLTCCPPGDLHESSEAPKHVIVATMARSGTHVMIDFILNNFPAYRHKPLYVDLDKFLEQDLCLEKLAKTPGWVVKTHFPELGDERHAEKVLELARNAHVIIVERNRAEVVQSMGLVKEFSQMIENFSEYQQRFSSFWKDVSILRVNYADLIDPAKTQSLCLTVADYLEMKPPMEIKRVPQKNQPWSIYLAKLLTRLFGPHAPVINTTIGFSKKQ